MARRVAVWPSRSFSKARYSEIGAAVQVYGAGRAALGIQLAGRPQAARIVVVVPHARRRSARGAERSHLGHPRRAARRVRRHEQVNQRLWARLALLAGLERGARRRFGRARSADPAAAALGTVARVV